MTLQIVELNPNRHDRKAFNCGTPNRNHYLQRLANQHRKSGFSITFVLVDSKTPMEIIGFYSMSAAQIDLGDIAEEEKQNLPKVPVPAARVGQLAVSLNHQGSGFGALLLQHAVKRALLTREHAMGVHMMIVDADSVSAANFYRKFGFKGCSATAHSLYLSLGRV
jgi:GNAT superfamily N-acetyltransferase